VGKRILVISDQHFPYQHADAVAFLSELKRFIEPDLVVNIGDEIDYHAISFHQHDPDLLSPSDELKSAIDKISPLFKIFPKMVLLESNHGSLVYRKGKHAGLPRHVFKSYREIIGAPKGWEWMPEFTLFEQNVYFHHGKSANGLKLSQSLGMNCVQGHYHSQFNIQYWSSPTGRRWSMHVGCLIDNSSLAFAYNKNTLPTPILGCGVIIDSQPILIPMTVDENNRWTRRL
jgi:hypothetical protein